MFAKLQKKIVEETAFVLRPGIATKIPWLLSKDSVASMGVDSGDDYFQWKQLQRRSFILAFEKK